jgi:hypothetical protein
METPNPALRYFDFYIDESPNGARFFVNGTLVSQTEFMTRREKECRHDYRLGECRSCCLALAPRRKALMKDTLRIMMDGPSVPTLRQQEEIQKQVCRLKDLLRDALKWTKDGGQGANAVISDRRTYKTTALIEYVAERLLILPPPARVAVVCPDYNIASHFDYRYRTVFPNVRRPIVTDILQVLHHGALDGSGTVEVYAEEVFAIPAAKLRQVPNFVVGIGTLIHPVSLRIENW